MKRLIALLAAIVLLLTFAPVAFAGTQGGCAYPQPSGSLQVWENILSDHGDGDDNLWVWCGAIIPYGGVSWDNFAGWPHTLPGGCQSVHYHPDDWNDCISHVTVFLPSSLWVVCFYQDKDENGQAAHFQGPAMGGAYNLPAGIRDEVSSIRMDNDGSC